MLFTIIRGPASVLSLWTWAFLEKLFSGEPTHSRRAREVANLASLVLSFLVLVALGTASKCQASNSFGDFSSNLGVQAGVDGQNSTSMVVGNVEIMASDAAGNSEASLTTAKPNGNVFTFDASATSASGIGSSEVEATLDFLQKFDVSEPMRVILSAELVNPASDPDVFASLVVNDGNRTLSLAVFTDTGGDPEIASLIFNPVDRDDLDFEDIHSISGLILTSANTAGIHTGSIQGSVIVTLPADLNGDLAVDGGDLAIWESGFGLTDAAFSEGDTDDNRNVNGADFLRWQRQLGSATTSTLRSFQVVPEPTSAGLMLVSAGFLSFWGRRLGRPVV